ncbi:MAG: formylglycine-generating enzyme family protein [Treponema sp.]|nr:formylglycine-generating enzyme family protein [Treponema sp.]
MKKMVLVGLVLLASVMFLVGCENAAVSGVQEVAKFTLESEGIFRNGQLLENTSEVPVITKSVDLESLYVEDNSSLVFISGRTGVIQSFVMGQYEVTQELYEAVMGTNPSYFQKDAADKETQKLRPVESVSWYDAVVFCNKLSILIGLEPVYIKGGQTNPTKWGMIPETKNKDWDAITCNWDANGYQLPTEIEWELAVRGGDPTQTAWNCSYAGSNEPNEVAWYESNSEFKSHQVGTLAPNSLGLYDMSGNVEELCWDLFDSNLDSLEKISIYGIDMDLNGFYVGVLRSYRGGGVGCRINLCRLACCQRNTLPTENLLQVSV